MRDPISMSSRDALFRGTVRIVISSRIAKGVHDQLAVPEVATGFIVESRDGDHSEQFIVTAAHVVSGADDGSMFFIRISANPEDGALFEFRRRSRFGEMWYYARDPKLDIAITPLSRDSEVTNAFLKADVLVLVWALWDSQVPDDEPEWASWTQFNDFEEVLFAGYPAGYWDPLSGSPIVRRGVTATPLLADYEGDPVFLIDAAIYPGCSGGPVVVIEPEPVPSVSPDEPSTHRIAVGRRERIMFLGMITDVQHERGNPASLLNLGRVVKAAKIFEAIRQYRELVPWDGSD